MMGESKIGGGKEPNKVHSPSAEAHRQVMELLRLGERSTNPDISRAAIEIAKSTFERERIRSTRVSPAWVLVAATALILVAVGACWYALLHYPGHIASAIVSVVTGFSVLAIALYALASGHLTQENFMKIFTFTFSRLKGLKPSTPSGICSDIQAQDGLVLPEDSDDFASKD
ncbi:MAG TPA: hypothetical protein VFU55_01030 [Terracidiphilus sp.]|nr:hypothetical protein [Terracidiphilus sp.]